MRYDQETIIAAISAFAASEGMEYPIRVKLMINRQSGNLTVEAEVHEDKPPSQASSTTAIE